MAVSWSVLCTAAIAVACSWWLRDYLPVLKASTCRAVEEGSRVRVKFELTLDEDGEVIDSSDSNGILDFVCGEGEVLPAMDYGVKGMQVGDTRAFPFGGEDGFGARLDANLIQVDLADLSMDLELGKQVTVPTDGGERNAIVAALNDTTATLDFNHPLAGKTLTMNVTLVGCTAPPEKAGIVVESVAPGDGETYPKLGDNLTVHYIGSFATSGEVFDSSRDKEEPYQFQIGVGQVIKGLDVGIMNMTLGERAILRIPSDLANRPGSAIPLKKDVVFDVELLSIN